MADEKLRQELDDLRRRVEQVERTLGLHDDADSARVPPEPTIPAAPPPLATHRSPPTAPASRPTPPPAAPPATPPTAPPTAPPLTAHRSPPAAPLTAHRSPPGSPIELLIGSRITAIVGGIIIVIGAGFLVREGLTSGWWGGLPALAQCLLVGAFGGVLLVGGEIVLRRISRVASVGLFGAGLGVLYLDAFATFSRFGLLEKEGAFLAMALVAVLGFAITLRTRFRTIGVLALVGGYMTPILLGGGGGHDLELLFFLTALFAIALALSALVPDAFRPLRAVALGGQILLTLVWLLNGGTQLWIVGIVFMSAWWSMLLAETVLAALRDQSAKGNAVTMLVASAAYVTAGCWIIGGSAPGGPDWIALFTLAIAVLGLAVAFQFGPGFDALRRRPKHAMDALALALWAQSGVLLAVANALQFDGFGESVGWLAIALAAIELGRRLRSRGSDVFGLVVGALALGRIALLDWWITPTMDDIVLEVGRVTVTQWSVLGLVAVAAVHAAARRFHAGRTLPWRAMPILLAVLGTAAWLAVTTVSATGLAVTGLWLAGAVALLALERFGRRERYLEIALFTALLAGARWLVVDALAERVAPGWSARDATPFLNAQMGLAAALGVTGWWAMRTLRRRAVAADAGPPRTGLAWQVVLLIGAGVLLIGMSFEIDRVVAVLDAATATRWSPDHVRQLALTLLWTLGSVGIGLLGVALRSTGGGPAWLVRRVAWSLLAACAVKWLVGDTLFWTISLERAGALALPRFLNLQLAGGLVLAAAALVLRAVVPPVDDADDRAVVDPWRLAAGCAPVFACVVVLWGLSFEVDRVIEGVDAARRAASPYGTDLLRGLWWMALWGAGGAAMRRLGTARGLPALFGSGWLVLAGSAVAWLFSGTLVARATSGVLDVPVVLNLQFGVGALLAVLLLDAGRHAQRAARDAPADGVPYRVLAAIGFTALGVIALWLGSIEIDRALAAEPMAAQAGLSVWWALFGVALVVIGFARRIAAARYVGLALLALTIGKVVLVDLSQVERLWRVLSFCFSGLLLVGTSILYSKLSPRLLAAPEPAAPESPGGDRPV